jgi:hypothetical protein
VGSTYRRRRYGRKVPPSCLALIGLTKQITGSWVRVLHNLPGVIGQVGEPFHDLVSELDGNIVSSNDGVELRLDEPAVEPENAHDDIMCPPHLTEGLVCTTM